MSPASSRHCLFPSTAVRNELSKSTLFQFKMPVCEIFGCILGPAVQFYLGWRAFCAIFNISSGVIFFALLFRSNRHLLVQASQFPNSASYRYFQRTNRAVCFHQQLTNLAYFQNNLITSVTILSEFFLSFLPHFGPFIWEKVRNEFN
jgi:hypothetical protein